MPNTQHNRGRAQDRARVAGGQDYEVRYEAKKTGASTDEVKDAVKSEGNSRRKVEQKFRGLLESAPDAIVIVDQSGRMVLVNSQTERLFGYSQGELQGQLVEMLLPSRLWTAHVGHRAKYSAHPRARSMGAGLPAPLCRVRCGVSTDARVTPVRVRTQGRGIRVRHS